MNFSQAICAIRDLSREDITDIVSDYVELKRSGSGMKGCCPFHDEKTPSFYVSNQKGIYKCFGCGVGGDAIDFVMKIDGKEFHEVIYQFADRFHITIDNTYNGQAATNQKPSPIPDIHLIRSYIRKEDQVTIVLTGSEVEPFQTKAITRLTAPLTKDQAQSLKPYTRNCRLVVAGLEWPLVRESIEVTLAAGFSVTIWNNEEDQDWLHAAVTQFAANRKEIINCIAAIPDDITRSVYETEYAYLLSESKKTGQLCT
jgi:hypothetical protein